MNDVKTRPCAPGAITKGAAGLVEPWLRMIEMVCEIAYGSFLMMSIYIPLVPFIIYFGAILNWVLNVVEGVAAAPFLAFAHLDTDGEGLGQKTTHGYGFMLQSFMRPTMIVFGFVVASLIVDAMGYFLTQIYPTVIANAQMNSWSGVLSIIGYISFFFVMAIGLVNSSFSIIYILPDAIFTFMGVQQSNTEFGRSMGDSARAGVMTGVGVTRAGGLGNSMLGGSGIPAGKPGGGNAGNSGVRYPGKSEN